MRIPTEHFAHVPVVLLSPSLLPSPEDEAQSSFPRTLMSRLMSPEHNVSLFDTLILAYECLYCFTKQFLINSCCMFFVYMFVTKLNKNLAFSHEGFITLK